MARAASVPYWRGPLAAAAFGMLLIIAGVIWFQYAGVIATAIGEQRQRVLEDGSRVFLNTDTRVVVEYSKEQRRVELSSSAAARLDTRSLDKAIAWRRGQVILDDTPLVTAIAEMNRYNSTKRVVENAEAAALLINELFQAGDSSHFANAIAEAYGLQLRERDDQIVLSGPPGSND